MSALEDQYAQTKSRTLGLEISAPPEMHKAQMWALWHGHRLSPEEMDWMPRAERLRKLDELAERLDPKLAPSLIRLWQADFPNHTRHTTGTAGMRHREMSAAWRQMQTARAESKPGA